MLPDFEHDRRVFGVREFEVKRLQQRRWHPDVVAAVAGPRYRADAGKRGDGKLGEYRPWIDLYPAIERKSVPGRNLSRDPLVGAVATMRVVLPAAMFPWLAHDATATFGSSRSAITPNIIQGRKRSV